MKRRKLTILTFPESSTASQPSQHSFTTSLPLHSIRSAFTVFSRGIGTADTQLGDEYRLATFLARLSDRFLPHARFSRHSQHMQRPLEQLPGRTERDGARVRRAELRGRRDHILLDGEPSKRDSD